MAGPDMTGVQWIAATLAPYAIAPHPNFSVKSVQPVELLALLADLRFNDFTRFREKIDSDVPAPTVTLVDAVRDSLLMESQPHGLAVLATLVTERDLPLGARCAGALFLSVGASELDEFQRALDALDSAIEQTAHEANSPTIDEAGRGSLSLIQAALRQNKVLRLIEANRYVEACDLAEEVQRISPGGKARFERFETSKGVAVSSRQVQLDISAALKSHALAARSRLQGLEGDLWTQVVRRRGPYLNHRTDMKALQAIGAIVKQQFDTRFAATVRRRHLHFGDPVDDPISAMLLHEELIGDVNGAGADRELLGRTRALRGDEWSLSEAIRLLRQAEARQPLGDVLRWIRADGPTEVLLRAAERILERHPRTPITRSDVVVLSSSAELLKEEQLGAAIRLVESHRVSPGQRLARESTAGWVTTQISWQALSRLLPDSGLDDWVASSVHLAITEASPGPQLYGSLVDVVSSLNWRLVSDSQRQRWVRWVKAHRSAEQYPLNSVILDEVRGVSRHADVLDRPTGLELGVRIVFEKAHGIEPLEDELRAVSIACRTHLEAIRESAARGSFAFGGIGAAELSVALISEFGALELWEPLGAFLADPNVNGSEKAPALDRLARDFHRLPDEFLGQFSNDWGSLIHVRSVEVFEEEPLSMSGAALRFLAAFGLSKRESLMDGLAQLAGAARVDAKVEAARSVSSIAARTTPDSWAWIFLLQLSHDPDPVVRGEAGRALASAHPHLTELERPVTQRLGELLQSDGILLPLLILKGLAESNDVSADLRDVVSSVSRTHLARSVRSAASELLDQA